jgi:hypothetical protein
MSFCKNAMWAKFKELLFVPLPFIFLLFIIHHLIVNQALF